MGNRPALLRVLDDLERFAPDHVIVNGDVVSRGPSTQSCLGLLDEGARGPAQWQFVRGNHEDYVASHVGAEPPTDPLKYQIGRLSRWTSRQIGDARSSAVGRWPFVVELDGGLRATHASMARNDRGIYKESDDAEIRTQIAPPPAVFATAHTHVPFVRRVDDTLVVNSGSVGTPFDGDVRASYVRLVRQRSGWRADVVRLGYDRDAAARDYETSGCLSDSGPFTRLIFQEWKMATPFTRQWFERFLAPVEGGRMTVEDAVEQFLAELS